MAAENIGGINMAAAVTGGKQYGGQAWRGET